MSGSDKLVSLSWSSVTPSELCCYCSGNEIKNCKPLIFLKCCPVDSTCAAQCLLRGNFITRSQTQNRSQSVFWQRGKLQLCCCWHSHVCSCNQKQSSCSQLLYYHNTQDRIDMGACSHPCLSQPSRKLLMIYIDWAVQVAIALFQRFMDPHHKPH